MHPHGLGRPRCPLNCHNPTIPDTTDNLDDGELETLFATLTPITRAVIAGGDIPVATPMGLRRDELDDDAAHLD